MSLNNKWMRDITVFYRFTKAYWRKLKWIARFSQREAR